jgi:hypothetical protein
LGFNGGSNRFPSGVFATRRDAEEWIAANRLQGTLTRYPLGVSVYDWAIRQGLFTPRKATHSSPDFIANFSSASQEHIQFDSHEDS